MIELKEQIILFLKDNLELIERDYGGGSNKSLPAFDLTPRDFVAFAEKDLAVGESSTHMLVNVTSNLKRAVDCQLDFLLSFLNLDKLYRHKRLGVDRKLGFLKMAGVFNARSMEKLNRFRNRLEHHYELPAFEDVDVYFDVVTAFVSIGESLISILMSSSEVSYYYEHGKNGKAIESVIDYTNPSIKLELGNSEDKLSFEVNLNKDNNPSVEDIEDFAFILKTHILLIHLFNGAITNTRLISDLEV